MTTLTRPATPSVPATPKERAAHAHSARRSQQIEGGDISAFAQELTREYVNGTATTAELRARLLEHYNIP